MQRDIKIEDIAPQMDEMYDADKLMEKADFVLSHAENNLPTDQEISNDIDNLSLEKKDSVEKFALAIEKELQDQRKKQLAQSPKPNARKLFKTKYTKI